MSSEEDYIFWLYWKLFFHYLTKRWKAILRYHWRQNANSFVKKKFSKLLISVVMFTKIIHLISILFELLLQLWRRRHCYGLHHNQRPEGEGRQLLRQWSAASAHVKRSVTERWIQEPSLGRRCEGISSFISIRNEWVLFWILSLCHRVMTLNAVFCYLSL